MGGSGRDDSDLMGFDPTLPPSADDTLPADSSSAGPGADAATTGTVRSRAGDTGAPLEAGRIIDHFRVVRRLGHGGMGVVLLAVDEHLERRVALKLLRTEALGDADPEAAKKRLWREAQAMARLVHENVITVYEVGVFEGQVFIAMEYVEDGTLESWTRREPRTWEEILGKYAAAAHGLAAAHRAGLVHRDFKPDNVLVGADGRVRVTDFGLVRATTDESGNPDEDASVAADRAHSGDLALALTRTGAVLGTPIYMAPEQHAGRHVGHRADQFSFCVSLYSAIYGQLPFAGDSYEELVANIRAGRFTPAPKPAQVPATLHAAILRGLATNPEDRHESMDALLAEIQRSEEPRADRRATPRVAIAAVALLGTAAVGATAVLLARGCDDARPTVTATLPAADAATPDANMPALSAGFEAAQQHFDEGNFLDAAAGFAALYRERPFSAMLYNVGKSYERAMCIDEAVESYRAYLAKFDGTESTEERANVTRSLLVLDGTKIRPTGACGLRRARAAFTRGVEAFDEGRYLDAVIELQTAHRERPLASLHYDTALSYERARCYDDAAEYYRKALSADASADATREAAARDARPRLVAIESLPDAARSKCGASDDRDPPHPAIAALPPATLQGAVLVESNADGATFRLEQQDPTRATPWHGHLPPGDYSLSASSGPLRRPDGKPVEKTRTLDFRVSERELVTLFLGF